MNTGSSEANGAPDIYLQPHSDDICFSLGVLAQTRRRGILLTAFPETPYLAREPRAADWEAVTRLRLAEDGAFAAACGLATETLALKTASLLRHATRDLRWGEENARRLEGPLTQALDSHAAQRGRAAMRPWLFCPCGIGGHVDHVAAMMVAARLYAALSHSYRLAFYEDLPYASEERARAEGVARLNAHLPGRALIRHAWKLGPHIDTKLKLMALYPSQFLELPQSIAAFTPMTGIDGNAHEAVWSEEAPGPHAEV